MKLNVENVGKIEKASIEINSITTIAGENNTGKSTIGKVLYSIFSSFYKVQDQITNDRKKSLRYALLILHPSFFDLEGSKYFVKSRFSSIQTICDSILKEKSENPSFVVDRNYLESIAKQYAFRLVSEDKELKNAIKRINSVLNVSDEEVFKSVVNQQFSDEFSGQICNLFTNKEAIVELTVRNKIFSLTFKDNTVKSMSKLGLSLFMQPIYMDNPMILDNDDFFYESHSARLASLLQSQPEDINYVEQTIAKERINTIYKKISCVCSGEIVFDNDRTGYRLASTDKTLDIHNLSVGLKSFAILKTLLEKGYIQEKGLLILDEPEIHLHPEWQLEFAELIVLLQKEFHLHILLNTHSPYFLNAIEVFAKKYGILDCRYYLAEKKSDHFSILKDVTDNTDAIYKTLAKPFQLLSTLSEE